MIDAINSANAVASDGINLAQYVNIMQDNQYTYEYGQVCFKSQCDVIPMYIHIDYTAIGGDEPTISTMIAANSSCGITFNDTSVDAGAYSLCAASAAKVECAMFCACQQPAQVMPPLPPPFQAPANDTYAKPGVLVQNIRITCDDCTSVHPIEGDSEGRLLIATVGVDASWRLEGANGTSLGVSIDVLDFYLNSIAGEHGQYVQEQGTARVPRYVRVTVRGNGSGVIVAVGIFQPQTGDPGGVEQGLVVAPQQDRVIYFKYYFAPMMVVVSVLLCLYARRVMLDRAWRRQALLMLSTARDRNIW